MEGEGFKIEEDFRGKTVLSRLIQFPGEDYYVSEYSSVYSNKTGTLKKLLKQKVTLLRTKEGKVNVAAQKMCLRYFKPSEKKLSYIKYIDGDKTNTHYTNMEWSEIFPYNYKTFTNESNKILKIKEIVLLDGVKTMKEVELRYFGHDGYYISEYGQPYSIKIGKEKLSKLLVTKRSSGFDYMILHDKKKVTNVDINLAVARAFLPIEKELPYVLFKDDDCSNRHYTNLYWSETCEKSSTENNEFQPIPGFSSYKINKRGICKTYNNGYPKIMKPFKDEKGYFSFRLVNDEGKKKSLRRGRVVGLTFIPNPKNKPEIDHRNRKRWDDRVENLKWATSKENNDNRDITAFLERCYRRVSKFTLEGDFLEEFKHIYEAAASIDTENFTGVPGTIKQCCQNNKEIENIENCQITYGFIWKYTTAKLKYQVSPGESLIPLNFDGVKTSYFITSHFNLINKHGYKKELYNSGGYPGCAIRINGVVKQMKMHRLVAIFFVSGRTTEKNVVHHKDANKRNYHPSNLEWVTQSMNCFYHQETVKRKAIHQFEKLTGKYIKTFSSKKEIIKEYPDIKTEGIFKSCREGYASQGFYWRYADPSIKTPASIETENTSKHVDQFTLEGKFIKRYESCKDAVKGDTTTTFKKVGIRGCCKGEGKTAYGYIWKFADINSPPVDLEIGEKDEGQYSNLPVIQSTIYGIYIKTFTNIFVAAKETGISAKRINYSCTGKYKTVADYIWRFDDKTEVRDINGEKDEGQYPKLKVIQTTERGVYIKTFNNIFAAANEFKVTVKKIHQCCIGNSKTVSDQGWKYENIKLKILPG